MIEKHKELNTRIELDKYSSTAGLRGSVSGEISRCVCLQNEERSEEEYDGGDSRGENEEEEADVGRCCGIAQVSTAHAVLCNTPTPQSQPVLSC